MQNFLNVMQIFGDENHPVEMTDKMRKMLDAQSLWDATMAFSIHEGFDNLGLNFVAHLSGYFHVKNNLGIVEHLNNYVGESSSVLSQTVVMLPEDKPEFVEKEHCHLADFVILTDLNQIE